MKYRDYDPQQDRHAVLRIWREAGWLKEQLEESVDLAAQAGRVMVAEVDGEAECTVATTPGTVRYLDADLPFSAVAAVTTSHVARKQGLGKCLTALAVAADAAAGALIAGLGMFEQGYYNQIGFGTGSYDHRIAFDPLRLNVRVKPRSPRRIRSDDWVTAHAARLVRWRGHGSCNLSAPEMTRLEMLEGANNFGLGYADGPDGALSHYFWCHPQDLEHGPYYMKWIVFQTTEQFWELMALIRSLGDQVRLVWMIEPPGIQMQDLLQQPFRARHMTRNSRFEAGCWAVAPWQMRICDLPGVLAQTHLPGDPVHFNLSLSDPIEDYLDEGAPWRGVGGDYRVELGPSSGAERGRAPALPTLSATVGAFTRMWLGVRPAGGLAMTDALAGPAELLARLDRLLRLPDPKPDWEY